MREDLRRPLMVRVKVQSSYYLMNNDYFFSVFHTDKCLLYYLITLFQGCQEGMQKPRFRSFKKPKNLKSTKFSFFRFLKQVAQLSQRDRAAGWVSNGQSGRPVSYTHLTLPTILRV